MAIVQRNRSALVQDTGDFQRCSVRSGIAVEQRHMPAGRIAGQRHFPDRIPVIGQGRLGLLDAVLDVVEHVVHRKTFAVLRLRIEQTVIHGHRRITCTGKHSAMGRFIRLFPGRPAAAVTADDQSQHIAFFRGGRDVEVESVPLVPGVVIDDVADQLSVRVRPGRHCREFCMVFLVLTPAKQCLDDGRVPRDCFQQGRRVGRVFHDLCIIEIHPGAFAQRVPLPPVGLSGFKTGRIVGSAFRHRHFVIGVLSLTRIALAALDGNVRLHTLLPEQEDFVAEFPGEIGRDGGALRNIHDAAVENECIFLECDRPLVKSDDRVLLRSHVTLRADPVNFLAVFQLRQASAGTDTDCAFPFERSFDIQFRAFSDHIGRPFRDSESLALFNDAGLSGRQNDLRFGRVLLRRSPKNRDRHQNNNGSQKNSGAFLDGSFHRLIPPVILQWR